MEFHTFIQETRKTLYPTAIEFFNSLSKTLNISYDYYVKIEKGKKLPRADKALQIAQALKVKNLRKYFYLYAKSMMPTPDTKRLFANHDDEAPPASSDVENLLWKYKSQLKYHLTDLQMQAIAESFDTYRFFSILLYNDLAVTSGELSKVTNKPETLVLSKLKPLIECGVVIRDSEDQRFRVAARYIKYPDTETYKKLKPLLDDYDQRLLSEGKLFHSRHIIKKTSSKKLYEILKRLDETERFVQAIEEDDETKNNRLIFYITKVIEQDGLLAKAEAVDLKPTTPLSPFIEVDAQV